MLPVSCHQKRAPGYHRQDGISAIELGVNVRCFLLGKNINLCCLLNYIYLYLFKILLVMILLETGQYT